MANAPCAVFLRALDSHSVFFPSDMGSGKMLGTLTCKMLRSQLGAEEEGRGHL